MKTRRTRLIALVMLFTLTACSDTELEKLNRAFGVASVAAQAAQDGLGLAVADGLLTAAQAQPILETAGYISQVAASTREALGKITALSPEDRQNVIKSIAIILDAVDQSENMLYLIPNVEVRRKIQASLLALRIAVAVLEV